LIVYYNYYYLMLSLISFLIQYPGRVLTYLFRLLIQFCASDELKVVRSTMRTSSEYFVVNRLDMGLEQ